MVTQKSIEQFQGMSLSRGRDFLYLSPHILLRPYISCYTVTFPAEMSDEYTILPTASSTMIISVSNEDIFASLRGVNTKACTVGAYANKMKLLLLIEFHSGGLCPFIKTDQFELTDGSFDLQELDKALTRTIEQELIRSEGIKELVEALDRIFLTRLINNNRGKDIGALTKKIILQKGDISTRELSSELNYSERHIRRLFLQYVGTTPKIFSRIVRVNYALRLIQGSPAPLIDVTAQAGFFDQPHFIHDFKSICGMTPMEYVRNMSVYYNDEFKM